MSNSSWGPYRGCSSVSCSSSSAQMNFPFTRTPDPPPEDLCQTSLIKQNKEGRGLSRIGTPTFAEWMKVALHAYIKWILCCHEGVKEFPQRKKNYSLHITSRKQTGKQFRFTENITKGLSSAPSRLHRHPHTKHLLTAWIPNSSLWVSPAFMLNGFLTRFRDRTSHISQPLGVWAQSTCQNHEIF